MSGVILYFTICLSRAPDTCEARRLPVERAGAGTCLSRAQPDLARWAARNPGWRITAWRCGAPPRERGDRT